MNHTYSEHQAFVGAGKEVNAKALKRVRKSDPTSNLANISWVVLGSRAPLPTTTRDSRLSSWAAAHEAGSDDAVEAKRGGS
jgi:hypothetical protein